MSLIQQMYDLVLLDQNIRGLSGRLDVASRRFAFQQDKSTQLQHQQAEMDHQFKHAQVKVSELEKQTAEIDERIERQRQQMNTVNNNKEYSSLLIEINTLKSEKGKVEDQTLEQMTQVEAMRQELSGIADRIGDQQKLVIVAESEVEECRSEVGDTLDRLMKERTEAKQQLPSKMRDTFDRLVRMHDGDAVASVVEENRRTHEYSCGGCYLAIPVETVSTLMSSDDIVVCTNCNRMLMLDQNLKTSLVK